MKFFFIVTTLILFLVISMIYTKTPINSILVLCTILLLCIIMLFFSHIEFLSYIFLMVYVGGIALLFLFVVLMLNVKIDSNKNVKDNEFLNLGPIFLLLGLIKLQSYFLVSMQASVYINLSYIYSLKAYYFFSNDILSIGLLLYTYNFFSFLLAGCLLLVSMIGVLVLSLNNIEKNVI